MDSRYRRTLRAELRHRVPDRVEDHKHRADVMPGGDVQEVANAPPEAYRVLLPQKVVQKNPHRIHTQRLGPGELLFDLGRIERLLLPHLQLVHGRTGHVVAAHEPGLVRVPGVRLPFRPAGRLGHHPVGRGAAHEERGGQTDAAEKSCHQGYPLRD
jgi:hypothetical protein